jgi:hypothetical protein
MALVCPQCEPNENYRVGGRSSRPAFGSRGAGFLRLGCGSRAPRGDGAHPRARETEASAPVRIGQAHVGPASALAGALKTVRLK